MSRRSLCVLAVVTVVAVVARRWYEVQTDMARERTGYR